MKGEEVRMKKDSEDEDSTNWMTCNEDGVADDSVVCNMLWISVIQDTISGLQAFTLHIE